MAGLLFLATLLLAPERGLVARWARLRRQRWQFAGEMLLVHLSQHEGTANEDEEMTLDHLERHMRWPPAFADQVADYVLRHGLAQQVDGGRRLALTEKGREVARTAMLR